MAKEALNIEEFEEEDFDEVSSEEEIDADVDVEDVPDGGIGDFVMSDEDLDAVYGEDDEDLDDERVASLPAIAARMAEYGRNEDDTLAHVATGELVIPAQFLKDDVIKQRIYDILSEAGVDNPEAYVVGAEENDLNPDTGLPEFFLKKIFKGIGKAIKGVVKVVKKALPVVLPIALSVFGPLGPVFGAALGSGIGTLVSGGSIGDALKSGLMSGAAGGIFAGFSGNTGSFMGNLREATGGIGERFSQFGTGIKEGAQNLASGDVGGFFDSVSGEYVPAAATGTPTAVTDAVTDAVADVTRTVTVNSGDSLSKIAAQQGITVDDLLKLNPKYAANPEFIDVGDVIKLPSVSTGAGEGLISRTFEAAKKNPIKTGAALIGGSALVGGLGTTEANALDPKFTTTGDMLLRDRPEDFMVNSLGNLVFDGETNTYITREERDRRERERNKVGGENIPPAISQVQGYQGPNLSTPALTIKEGVGRTFYKPTDAAMTLPNYMAKDIYGAPIYRPGDPRDVGQGPVFESRPYVSPEFNPVGPTPTREEVDAFLARQQNIGMADGGHVFPRRNGGISPDEGIAGKDSVKAMLMPGEFVMTTKAVRGLGNGDLNNGIKNMYSVMRNLEKRGRAA